MPSRGPRPLPPRRVLLHMIDLLLLLLLLLPLLLRIRPMMHTLAMPGRLEGLVLARRPRAVMRIVTTSTRTAMSDVMIVVVASTVTMAATVPSRRASAAVPEASSRPGVPTGLRVRDRP